MSRFLGVALGAAAAALAVWWFETRRLEAAAGEGERGEVIFSNRPLA